MKLMSKIDRIAAWVLLLCFMLFVLTGFDNQLRFFSAPISSLIHLKYLFPVAQIAFIIHTSYALHLKLKRKSKWSRFGKTLISFYVLINLTFFGFYILVWV